MNNVLRYCRGFAKADGVASNGSSQTSKKPSQEQGKLSIQVDGEGHISIQVASGPPVDLKKAG